MKEYLNRIEKAVDFIENNLTQKIRLEDIAREACFSMYHFHRIFQGVIGESAVDYIRKRRLTKASQDLLNSDEEIIQIALNYQFESQASFTRAFKKRFRITPGKYRTIQIRRQLFEASKLDKLKIYHLKGGISMEPKIVTKKEFKVIGMKCVSTHQNNTIPQLWDEFIPRMQEIKNMKEGMVSYGICVTDPEFNLSSFNDQTEFSYIAGVEVTHLDHIPEGMCTRVIPTQDYAVFTHRGSLINLKATFDYIYGTWVPKAEYELTGTDDFEYYDDRFKGMDDPDSEVDIYIPVKKND